MVKWSDIWLAETDANGVIIKEWAKKSDKEERFRCILCCKDLKFPSDGSQALHQHATI